MKYLADSLLLLLIGLLATSMVAFFLGFLPYPYGMLVLGILIVARVGHLSQAGNGKT